MAMKSTSSKGITRKPESGTTSPALALVKPLEARGPDGRKLLAPFLRGSSQRRRQAAATAITAGIATGTTNGELARAIRKTRSVAVARRSWRKLIRDSVRQVIAITRWEERAIEEEFLRRLRGPLKLVEVRRA